MAYDENLIGTEGLPNLYFSNIEIYEKNQNFNDGGIVLNVEMFYNNSLGLDRKPVIQFSGTRGTASYIDVVISISNTATKTIMSAPIDLNSDIIKNLIRRKEVFRKKLRISTDADGLKCREITPIYMNEKISLEGNIKHATLFANIVTERRRKKKIGPTICERILETGRVPLNSRVFLNTKKDSIWTGPVHSQPQKGFMEGSFHTTTTHDILRPTPYYNLKIKDYRKTESLITASNNPRMITNSALTFSDILFTQTEDKALSFMFSFDPKNILLQNSKYAAYLKESNLDIFDSLAKRITVKSVKMSCKTDIGQRRFITTDGLSQEKQMRNGKLYAKANQVVKHEDPNLISIECLLYEESVEKISVTVEIDDPIKKQLIDLYSKGRSTIDEMKEYVRLIESRECYDRHNNRFKRKELVSRYDQQGEPWLKAVSYYFSIKQMLKKQTEEGLKHEMKNLFSKVSPRSCTRVSIGLFMKELNDLFDIFSKTFELSNHSIRGTSVFGRGRAPRGSSSRRRISAEKTYKLDYKFRENIFVCFANRGRERATKIFKTSQFISLMNNQRNKMTNEEINLEANISAPFDVLTQVSLGNKELATLSPYILYNNEETFMYNELKNVDEEKLEEFCSKAGFSNLLLVGLFGSNISAERYKSNIVFQDVTENLTSDTNFFNSPQSMEDSIDPQPIAQRQIERALQRPRSIGKPIAERFDISTPNNIFDNRFGSVQNIPVQHLFLSTEEISEKVIGNRKEFLTNKPYTRDLAFFNLQKVKYLSYRTDFMGQRILSSAELKPLSKKKILETKVPLMCNLSLYIDPTLYNPDNNLKEYKLCNSYFIIIPDQYNRNASPAGERERYKEVFQEIYQQYSSTKFYETGYLKGGVCEEPSFRKETNFNQRPLATNSEEERESAREINSQRRETSRERREREQEESVRTMTNRAQRSPPVRQQERSTQPQRQQSQRVDTPTTSTPTSQRPSDTTTGRPSRQQNTSRRTSPQGNSRRRNRGGGY
tara:strand:+ start:1784 stop:4789 length:3006 start_codon:yes stop_codon:yes gene_type:complete